MWRDKDGNYEHETGEMSKGQGIGEKTMVKILGVWDLGLCEDG